MDLLYNLKPSRQSPFHRFGHSGSTTATSVWSSNNLIAYPFENVVKGYSKRYVNIIDPNQPWKAFKIPFKGTSVKILQWHDTGTMLLIADSCGICTVWVTLNHMTNVWREKPIFTTDQHSESILAASWLCNGKKIIFHLDKLDKPSEKLSRVHLTPSLSQMGGQPMDGYVVVTASGLVVVKCITQNDQSATTKKRLNIVNNLVLAEIAFSAQGDIIVMGTDCDVKSPIHFWAIDLTFDNDTAQVSIQISVLPTIDMKCVEDPLCTYKNITHISFISRFNAEHVLICASGSGRSVIESWLLKKESQTQLYPTFLATSSSTEKMHRWQHVLDSTHPNKIVGISMPSLPVSSIPASMKASAEQKFYCGTVVAVAYSDNSIQLLHRITLAPVISSQIPETVTSTSENLGKRKHRESVNSVVQHIMFSPTSCALAVFDRNSCIMMYKVAPWLQKEQRVAPNHLAQLLYFCIITGYDWWDVLLHMQSKYVNSVCEQLSEDLSNQPIPLQQMLKSRLLSAKISIYQVTHRHAEASDCHLRLMFEAIAVVFRSLLIRLPHDSTEEEAPADKLHEACSSSFETDITKLLQAVDTDVRTLQSLQQLIQWVADVTLHLLSIVRQPISTDVPGSSLIYDKNFLNTLRELLVIIQTWKLLKSACAPVFVCLDDRIDCLPHIFKLLTEVSRAITIGGVQCHIPDNIVDECCLLPKQICIPSIDFVPPVDGVLSRLNAANPPFSFEIGLKPSSSLHTGIFSNSVSLKQGSQNKVDNLRRIFLGISPVAPLKSCTRCGVVSLLNSFQDVPVEFWDQRFISTCLCGGSWRIDSTNLR